MSSHSDRGHATPEHDRGDCGAHIPPGYTLLLRGGGGGVDVVAPDGTTVESGVRDVFDALAVAQRHAADGPVGGAR